jgi:alkanesulfonate monooxygenase SsuD/methylene tetrahydromethanopterin reductase-like flavin-dependent oxidoreductase (luciferase family)
MRFGISVVVGSGNAERPNLKRVIRERLEMARTAQAAGFEVASTGQHFGQPHGGLLAQPMPLLARMAAEAPEMTLQIGVLLVPFYHPVTLAEEMATLHAITDGRFQIAAGLGYRDTEFEMYGIARKERLPRTVETIGIVRELLAGQTVTHAGRFFTLNEVSLGEGAVEQPGPRVFLGTAVEPGIERAARIADGVYLDGHWLKSQVGDCVQTYQQALAAHGTRGEFSVRRELLLGASRKDAIDAGRSLWAQTMDNYRALTLPGPLQWISDELRGGGYSRELPFIAGAPEECAEELVEYGEMGVETIVIRMQGPGLGINETLKSIERFGTEILPAVRKAGY